MNAARPGLQIRLFGQPRLEEAAAPLGFRTSARALSLFVYLLLHRDEPLARDTIAFEFWPDVSESEARAKLRYVIRDLRTALPVGDTAPWILIDSRAIRWNPEAKIWLDVAEFERLAADPRTVGEAVDLYRGDLAARLDDAWLQGPREKLRELQAKLLRGLIEASRAHNDLRRALAYARRLVLHDPWDESSIRNLLQLLNETGDRVGALQCYTDFAARLQAEFGVEPMPETTAICDRFAVTTQPPVPMKLPEPSQMKQAEPRHNLNVALSTFVGREPEVAGLRSLLEKRRVVTLVGAGGVGKTRLAIETARTLVDHFTDGVWLVELASIADPTLIVSMILSSLGVQSHSEPSLSEILQAQHALLILDNCEHLIADIAGIVEMLVAECPRLHVLGTSREPLRIAGERIERVVSLELPDVDEHTVPSFEKLGESPAVRLFVERATDVFPAFKLQLASASDRTALGMLVRRLDGIPLAIELAAARMSSLSVEAVARGLDDRFTLLTAGKRTALPRQQTLRATLDWSYDLLTPTERCLLRRLAIFVGGWKLEAVIAICADDVVEESRALDVLASLVDKSLVVVEARTPEVRYRLLETTRAYAMEWLAQEGEQDSIARKHAEYFLAFARRNDRTWGVMGSDVGLERLAPELENNRAALRWTIDAANDPGLGAALIGALRWSFSSRSLSAEAVRWCGRASLALGPHPQPAHEAAVQLAVAGSLGALPLFPRFHFYRAARPTRFLAAAERAAALLREVGDESYLSLALSLTALHLQLSNEARSIAVAAEALAVARSSGNRLAVVMALHATSFAVKSDVRIQRVAFLNEALEICKEDEHNYHAGAILHALGEVAFEFGDPVLALSYAKESAAMLVGLAPVNQAQAYINCAAYCLSIGKTDEARTAARDALAVARRIGDPMITAGAFQHFAGIATALGDADLAARLLGASNSRRAAGAATRLFTEQTGYDRTIASVREARSQEQIDHLTSEGYGWSVDLAIEQSMLV